ncbi:unnamed protein product [Caenorhabditis auriculariae]|uniref:Major facilitator superfamily (MFS) profile domain-containing protein n=1 Tax=Caenorhabditis auriculariae TaxID=2777116 RepID=A0A8S1HI11_9PELO|nr:unnamed protein product [Caenorhabditis auriculariae]
MGVSTVYSDNLFLQPFPQISWVFRRSFLLCGVISIIPALFFPMCVNAKTYLLACVLRIFQGCSLAIFIPYVCKLSVFLPFDHLAIPAIAFAYTQISEIFAPPLSTILSMTSFGWHAPQYAACIIIFILFLLFVLIHFDEDFKYRASSIGFCNAMFEYERTRSRTFDLRIPYLSIYQDFRIWVIFFSSFAYGCALQLFLQFGPTFLHKVVGHDEFSASIITMFAPVSNILVTIVSLVMYSRLANTETNKMRFFNTVGFVVCGVFLFAMGWFDPIKHNILITLMFVMSSSMLGCSYAGHFRMNQMRAGHLHLFLLVNLFFVQCAAMFTSSLLNVLIAKNTDYGRLLVSTVHRARSSANFGQPGLLRFLFGGTRSMGKRRLRRHFH